MLAPIDRLSEVEARLSRLGRRCQILQGAVSILVLALLVLTLAGADALNRFKSLETGEIVLRDAAGKKRGWFGVGDDGNARLSIFDREERETAMFGVAPDGASIVYLAKGGRAVTVGVDGESVPRIELLGEGKGGASFYYHPQFESGLFLRDKQGRTRLSATLAGGGQPQMIFKDADDKMRIGFGGAPDRSYSLTFLDEREAQRLTLGLSGDRKAHLDLFEHPKKARMGMSAGPDGDCEFSIQDRNGKPRIGFELFDQGDQTMFRMDDGSDETGILMTTNTNGRVYQVLTSKIKNTLVNVQIDEAGAASMVFAEHRNRPRLGVSMKPGSDALFFAKDEQGKDRANMGVTAEGNGKMEVIKDDKGH